MNAITKAYTKYPHFLGFFTGAAIGYLTMKNKFPDSTSKERATIALIIGGFGAIITEVLTTDVDKKK